MERSNDGRKKRKRVEGDNLAANKIRDARCERNMAKIVRKEKKKKEYDKDRYMKKRRRY